MSRAEPRQPHNGDPSVNPYYSDEWVTLRSEGGATPGPWEIRGTDDDGNWLVCNERGPDTLIVVVESRAEADALLIAMAPEMAALLEGFVAWDEHRSHESYAEEILLPRARSLLASLRQSGTDSP